jgi:hypothetical protein
MYKQSNWLIVLIVFFMQFSALAQLVDSTLCNNHGCCCNNDPTPASVMISHVHKKHEWMVSYRYMGMDMDGLLSGTTTTTKNDVYVNYLMAGNKMSMNMHMVMAMYGVTNKLTLMAMFNYNIALMSMSMLDTGMPHMHGGMVMGGTTASMNMKTAGLGDIKLQALYSVIKRPRHQLLVSAGISIPTGNTQLKGGLESMYPNQRYPYAMQLGSGTFDVMPGINYLYQKGKITMSSQVTSVIRTGYNSIGYKLGNEATSNSWLAYQWHRIISSSIRMEASMAKKIDGYDQTLYYYNEPSANSFNYGGKKVNVFIGSVFQFKRGILKNNRLGIEYGQPIYQNLNGIQMKTKQAINASWAITF